MIRRNRMALAGLVLFLAAGLVSAAGEAGTTYYVSPNGDDAADGSKDHPWKTITRALTAAGPGVTVRLHGVTTEAVVIDKGGEEGKPFTLESVEGERAALDGDYKVKVGITVQAPFVTIRGLEVKKCLRDGMWLCGPKAHHVLIERNVIHHISDFYTGLGEPSRGIWAMGVTDCTIRGNTVYYVVGHNECFGVLFDLRSSFKVPIRNVVIEKNLFYFMDKSGVRVVDNTVGPARCHVLAEPLYVRGNLSIHNAYVGLEVNYVNSSVTEGAGPLGGKPGAPVYVEDNFVGWCGSYGINPKQSQDGVSRHNTIYRTFGIGYYQSGGASQRMRVEGNLFVDNTNGSIIHTVGEDNRFVGNYYRQQAPWLDFFWDRTKGWGTTWTDIDDLRKNSDQHPEEKGVLNNEAKLFTAPERGDFRLLKDAPARGKAPDGEDFGARESRLVDVGASGKYGLANVPDLGEITGLRVVEVSSEDLNAGPRTDAYYSAQTKALDMKEVASGAAKHLVDGALFTVWRPANGETSGWVVLDIPGDQPTRIGTFMILASHTAYLDEFKRHMHEFKLHVRTSPDEPWKEVGKYARYQREEGRVFPIGIFAREGPPLARQVKLEVLSNHGAPILEVAEFRLYRAVGPVE